MDWLANVGVNVSVSVTLQYMGQLYAEQRTVGNWLYSIEALQEAISRVWIYQERAFGALDSDGVDVLVLLVREAGLDVRSGKDTAVAIDRYVDVCLAFAQVLVRRGYETSYKMTELKHCDWTYYIGGQSTYRSVDRVIRRSRGDDRFSSNESWHALYTRATRSRG